MPPTASATPAGPPDAPPQQPETPPARIRIPGGHGGTRAAVERDSLLAWVTASGASSNFQPLDGNYRALVGTGDLRLVRNDSLRARLASYTSSLESEAARQGQLRQAMMALAGPLISAFPFMRRVFLHDVSAAQVDVAALRADPRASEVLFALQAAASNRLSGLRSLRDETRRLRRALEAEPAASDESSHRP